MRVVVFGATGTIGQALLPALAREHDVVVACDEAYSELWFAGDAPVSALQLADRTNVVVLNTLSKRSSMPGYRSGFVAGDARLIAALKKYRPNVGTTPQEFVQRASVVAWDDEACAVRLLEHGVVCAPGSFFGAGGAGHVRFALVPTPEACEAAAHRLRR